MSTRTSDSEPGHARLKEFKGRLVPGPEVPCELVDALVVHPGLADRRAGGGPEGVLPDGESPSPSGLGGGVLPGGVLEGGACRLLLPRVPGRSCPPADSAGRLGRVLLPLRREERAKSAAVSVARAGAWGG